MHPSERAAYPYANKPKNLNPVQEIQYDNANLDYMSNYWLGDQSPLDPEHKEEYRRWYEAEQIRNRSKWMMLMGRGYRTPPVGIPTERTYPNVSLNTQGIRTMPGPQFNVSGTRRIMQEIP